MLGGELNCHYLPFSSFHMGPSVLFSSLVILNRIKNNGIGDAGNTADFRMLFEMFEIFEFFEMFDIFDVFELF